MLCIAEVLERLGLTVQGLQVRALAKHTAWGWTEYGHVSSENDLDSGSGLSAEKLYFRLHKKKRPLGIRKVWA